VLSNILHKLAAYPVLARTPPVLAALVVPGPSVLPSSLVMISVLLVLIVAGLEGKRLA